MDIEIYKAEPEDCERLKEIALASKGYWGYSEVLISQWTQTFIITPESIDRDKVYLARINSLIIGWYRLLVHSTAAVLEDLWVLPDYIGKGVGRKLFEHAVMQAKLSGLPYLELEADPNAEPFYTKMGCHKIGERISEWGRAIPHMIYDLRE